jgi:hypothetical protein
VHLENQENVKAENGHKVKAKPTFSNIEDQLETAGAPDDHEIYALKQNRSLKDSDLDKDKK